jgi:hypothetical protein
MRTLNWEYRIVWRRQGDSQDRKKIFATTRSLYTFLLRVGTQTPWKGMGKGQLRAACLILAGLLDTPIASLLSQPIREVTARITGTHKPILWLRVEQRQVMKWVEVGDPLVTLRPATYGRQEARIEAFCDELDKHPEQRWAGATQKDHEPKGQS